MNAEFIRAVRDLRAQSGLSIRICSSALKETNGDIELAFENLAKTNHVIPEREAKVVRIHTYQHYNGRCGSIGKFRCQTDFVARSEEFKQFMTDVCIHAAYHGGLWKDAPFVKDLTKTITDLINEISNKTGEKVEIEEIVSFSE